MSIQDTSDESARIWDRVQQEADRKGHVTVTRGPLEIMYQHVDARTRDRAESAETMLGAAITNNHRLDSELEALRARITRLQAAYLDVEADAIADGAREHCINHPAAHAADVAESLRQGYRNRLQPGDLDPVVAEGDDQ